MLYLGLKYSLTAFIIVLITEVAKRSSLFAAALTALPIMSILSMLWIYFETKDSQKIAAYSMEIFWLVLPTLIFFVLLSFLIKKGIPFMPSLLSSIAVMLICFWGYMKLIEKIKL